jgi:serine/threonine protein kinase
LAKKRGSPKNRQVGDNYSLYSLFIEFMLSCMIVGLEYMHNNGVIHRDIKPENVVMDENGYVRITDLGIARIWTPENSQDTSGTPGYMGNTLIFSSIIAPEVMCRQNHCCAVDYFAIGVIGYEFMLGKVRIYSIRLLAPI